MQCSGFKQGSIAGPLCHDLCQAGNVRFDKCLTSDPDKQVFRGTLRGRDVILKVVHHWFKEFDEKKSAFVEDDLQASYKNLILGAVTSICADCSQCEELTEKFTTMADVNKDGQLTRTEVTSFLALLAQQEPAMLIALNGSKHSLDFFGYCGGIYAVERLPFIAGELFGVSWMLEDLAVFPVFFDPLEELVREYMLKLVNILLRVPYISDILKCTALNLKNIIYRNLVQIKTPTVEETFEFLLGIMDMVLDLSNKPCGILQSCDAHEGNFGLTNNLTVKPIDFDLIYTKPVLARILSQKSCLSHDECKVGAYDECTSPCDFETGLCSPQPNSQDLQYICRTIFRLVFENRDLSSQYLRCLHRGITGVVSLCSNLSSVKSKDDLASHVDVVKSALKKVKAKCQSDA